MDISSKKWVFLHKKFILYANTTYIKYKTREAIHYYCGLTSNHDMSPFPYHSY